MSKEAAVRNGDGVMDLVQRVTEFKMDIRKIQGDVVQAEHEIIGQLIRERRVECLSINYAALRRNYHD